MSTYLSTYLPYYLSTYVPMYLCTYLPISLSIYLPIYLSAHLPIYFSIYLPTNLMPLNREKKKEEEYENENISPVLCCAVCAVLCCAVLCCAVLSCWYGISIEDCCHILIFSFPFLTIEWKDLRYTFVTIIILYLFLIISFLISIWVYSLVNIVFISLFPLFLIHFFSDIYMSESTL